MGIPCGSGIVKYTIDCKECEGTGESKEVKGEDNIEH